MIISNVLFCVTMVICYNILLIWHMLVFVHWTCINIFVGKSRGYCTRCRIITDEKLFHA